MEPILINPLSTKDLYLLDNADTSEFFNFVISVFNFLFIDFFIILLLSDVFI